MAKDKLNVGKLAMFKNSLSTTANLCAYVKVDDLLMFLTDLVKQVRNLRYIISKSQQNILFSFQVLNQEVTPGSLGDPSCELYSGELWVMWGGDTGGGTTKLLMEVLAAGPHMCGMYSATDVHVNLETFMRSGRDWVSQLEALVRCGLEVEDKGSGEKVIMKVQLFLCGDMLFQCEVCGHQGCASTHPCLKCEVSSQHLRKGHSDGSEHSPNNPVCMAATQPRSVASFENNYLANIMDQRMGGDLRKNGHHHHSIVARSLFPFLQSVLHIPPATLHIGISFGGMAVLRLEIGADIRDGKARDSDLVRIADMADPDAEETEGNAEQDGNLDREVLEMRLRKVKLDREWAEVTTKVEELHEREEEAAKDVTEREHLAERVRLAAAGKTEELGNLAKSQSKVRVPSKRFSHCNACILSPFDKKVQWKVCTECNTRCHLLCQLESIRNSEDEEVFNAALPFVCRKCRGVFTFPDLLNQIEKEMEKLKERGREVSKLLAAAKVELGLKRGEVEDEKGEHRQHLDRLLVEIGATRQEFHGGAFIGRHVDKIFASAERLADVLEAGSEAQLGFLEFAVTYRRIHFLIKAKRQLTEEEICELEVKCALMGEIMPRVLGGNITPKQHELIHHVPQFARRWRTVGFFREEGMEAKHHEVNGINRVMACMRKEEERLAMCLRRVEVRQVQKAGDLAVAVPRKNNASK